MYTRIAITSLCVSLLLGFLAFQFRLSALLHPLAAYILLALAASLATTLIVLPARNAAKRSRPSTASASSGNAASAKKETGSVKWFSPSKGFGFITRDNGDDIFVHFRSIMGKGHRVLREGQRVEFAVTEGNKGLQAEDVIALN